MTLSIVNGPSASAWAKALESIQRGRRDFVTFIVMDLRGRRYRLFVYPTDRTVAHPDAQGIKPTERALIGDVACHDASVILAVTHADEHAPAAGRVICFLEKYPGQTEGYCGLRSTASPRKFLRPIPPAPRT